MNSSFFPLATIHIHNMMIVECICNSYNRQSVLKKLTPYLHLI
ncbi:hypothetical protein HMPREF1589_05668 [Escherichia coli 113290]|nr:hypothetical protein HMPREF1589_05668 [Escherichia coli 113290]